MQPQFIYGLSTHHAQRGALAGLGKAYNVVAVKMDLPLEHLPTIEVIDDEMAKVIGAKTGAERLAIASRMYASARGMLLSHLRAEHADWDEPRIVREAARRLSHGAA